MTRTPPILPVAIGAFAIVAYLLLIDFSLETFTSENKNRNTSVQVNSCPNEATICPDGSYVGRTGPACDFATCPKVPERTTATETTKTYTGIFSFEYPTGWGALSVETVTPADNTDLYTGQVSQVWFMSGQSYRLFSVYTDDVTGALPFWLESSRPGECVDGWMTYSPAHVGAKFPCQNVTIAGQTGVLVVRNTAQEGCYDLAREYYLNWPSAPYTKLAAHQNSLEVFDVQGPNGEIYCTQDVDVQKRMQEVLEEKNLTIEQQIRVDEFDAAVRSLRMK